MNRITEITKTLLLGLCLLTAAACARHKIIPDKTLAEIFHDAFLTNAYLENRRFSTDSLDIYSPIFEKYGYTVADVQYTLGNFSKRKNARLGDVVERTIKQLEEEGLYWEREAAVLDTIDNMAQRAFRRTIVSDSLIRVARLRDTDRLHITLDNLLAGEYKIDFDYRVDSLDDATSRRAVFIFQRADSTLVSRQQQSIYRNYRTEHISRTMVADTTVKRLKINLMEFSQPRAPRKLNHFGVTFSNFRVVYTPNADAAVDSLFERQLPVRIFFKDFFQADDLQERIEGRHGEEPIDDAADAD